ncbi:hypothetical protein [Arthrobacter sp. H5]|uniref:hypothetical protein n=1 Tax=Arthrobacter sp. H5 TaxID=1267973 RepID=UPI0004888DB6|nr:hypothetical protein [Arthrobacter sp. H5]
MTNDEKREIDARYNYSQAPVVLVINEIGTVLDRWAGFQPDKILKHAAAESNAALDEVDGLTAA